MELEDFRELCETVGLTVTEEADGQVLCGESEDGDEVWFRKGLDIDGYVIDIDPNGYTVDKTEFRPSKIGVEDGAIVVDNVSGTRSSSGYGNTGYAHARLEIRSDGSKLIETH